MGAPHLRGRFSIFMREIFILVISYEKVVTKRQEQRQFRNPSDLGLRVNNSFGTEKALREQESNQNLSYCGSLEYFVLLSVSLLTNMRVCD